LFSREFVGGLAFCRRLAGEPASGLSAAGKSSAVGRFADKSTGKIGGKLFVGM
jgi:hypothetical protein